MKRCLVSLISVEQLQEHEKKFSILDEKNMCFLNMLRTDVTVDEKKSCLFDFKKNRRKVTVVGSSIVSLNIFRWA